MSALKKAILGLVGERFLSEARVAETNAVSRSFRFIDLESPAFRGLRWRPGEKVQINVGDWNVRTYTPLSLDPEEGRLGVLAYVHGNGPGSRWAATARPGDVCRVLGPRASLNVSQNPEPVVLFGDETAVAMATTLKRSASRPAEMAFVFESAVPDEIQTIARDVGLESIEVLAPACGAEEAARSVLCAVEDLGGSGTCRVILAGKAQSIQAVRERLRTLGFPMGRVRSKAYWSEGRSGLD